jgi:hypothetical protein
MDLITHMINSWLAKNNLGPEGVRIIIEFLDQEDAYRAEMTIKREIEPYLAHYVTGGTFGAIETMNGLGLSLRAAPSAGT